MSAIEAPSSEKSDVRVEALSYSGVLAVDEEFFLLAPLLRRVILENDRRKYLNPNLVLLFSSLSFISSKLPVRLLVFGLNDR